MGDQFRWRTAVLSGVRGADRMVECLKREKLYVFEGDIILGDEESLSQMELEFALETIRLSRSSIQSLSNLPQEAREAVALLRAAMERHGGALPAAGIADAKRRWPDGLVHYSIAPNALKYSDRILAAMELWKQGNTGIEFRERKDEKAWVEIQCGGWTSSELGFRGRKQTIEICDSLCEVGNIAHEIGHTLGLFHEQSRSDRDTHIEVIWSNILPEAWGQFRHAPESEDIGEYDMGSIMHYPMYAFARNPALPTLRPRTGGESIGQRARPSDKDLDAIRRLYPRQII